VFFAQIQSAALLDSAGAAAWRLLSLASPQRPRRAATRPLLFCVAKKVSKKGGSGGAGGSPGVFCLLFYKEK